MNILHEIMRGVWFMDPAYAQNYLPVVANLLKGDIARAGQMEQDFKPQNQEAFIMSGGKPHSVEVSDLLYNPDQITEPSIFSTHVIGPVTKYDQFCGPAGMKTKSNWMQMADEHPNIFAHLLRLDSGGGEGYAGRLMTETVKQLKKPVFAFVDDMAASAAYMIASAADHITINSNQARVGSVGTYISIYDYQNYFEKEGIRIVDVYAKQSSEKNQDYIRAINGDLSGIQTLVDQFNDFFLSSIQQNRGEHLTSDEWNTGKMFFADDAIRIGLADNVAPLNVLLTSIFNEYKP